MSFLSCTFDDGIFALKLDFSFFRSLKRDEGDDDAVGPQLPPHKKRPKKTAKSRGEMPPPPPFALPPLKRVPTPVNLLLDAPALTSAPPPPSSPNVIVDRSITQVGLESPDRTLGIDEDDDSPLEGNKTDLVQQRRAIRKALRSAR